MNILGLNTFHGDAAACLVVDGELVAAAEEERFRRVKHWAGLPTESIRYCLDAGGIPVNKIDRIALNRNPKVNLWRIWQSTLLRLAQRERGAKLRAPRRGRRERRASKLRIRVMAA